jgi:GR25 family glycosyltransferase involved in LPS biosynthesis
MNVTKTADGAVRRIPEQMVHANVRSALDNLRQGNAHRALAVFAEAFRNGIDLPPEEVASVMIEVARALIWAFEFDRQSAAAYRFLRSASPEVSDVIAQLLELANFPAGNEDPAAREEPIMLAYAGSLSAAGRHERAVAVLARLLEKSPNQPALSHAMVAAQRRQAGLPDDLPGSCSAPRMKNFVLNLDRRADKYESFLRQNGACGIAFERFSASDGSQMSEADVMALRLVAPGARFTRGAVGCAASHSRIWKSVVEQGVPALVFEDDAAIRHDVNERLATLLPALGNWDYVAVGYNTDAVLEVEPAPGMKTVMTSLPKRPDDRTVALFQGSTTPVGAFRLVTAFGTSGYVVSPAGARKLLQLCFPIDNRSYARTLFGQTVEVPVSGIDHMLNCVYDSVEAYACFAPLVLPHNDVANSTTQTGDARGWDTVSP